jgi:acetylornithine deacetylase
MDPGVEMSGWTVDPYGAKFEDGWIWGMGAHDDKGGCVAAICALEAIVRSGTHLRGDVLMTPVIAHKLGGAGTPVGRRGRRRLGQFRLVRCN